MNLKFKRNQVLSLIINYNKFLYSKLVNNLKKILLKFKKFHKKVKLKF